MSDKFDPVEIELLLRKWQKNLRLLDWDIELYEVNEEWRKTGDIKIDVDDRKALLMINNFNPGQTNIEELIIHELLHLKLWGMDQLIEEMINMSFGPDEDDPKYKFAYRKFMGILEPTVEDLTKSFLLLENTEGKVSFGRLQSEIDRELDENRK